MFLCFFDFFDFFDDFCWISLKLDFHFCGFSSDFFLVLGLGAWGLEPGLEFGLQAWACSLQCSSCQGLGLVPEP